MKCHRYFRKCITPILLCVVDGAYLAIFSCFHFVYLTPRKHPTPSITTVNGAHIRLQHKLSPGHGDRGGRSHGQETSPDGNMPLSSPERQHGDTRPICAIHPHRAVDVVSDAAAPTAGGLTGTDMPSDGRMNVQDDGVVPRVSTEDSIVSLRRMMSS